MCVRVCEPYVGKCLCASLNAVHTQLNEVSVCSAGKLSKYDADVTDDSMKQIYDDFGTGVFARPRTSVMRLTYA